MNMVSERGAYSAAEAEGVVGAESGKVIVLPRMA